MLLRRLAPLVALAMSLSSCVPPMATTFTSIGTSVEAARVRPLADQVSLVECDDPSLQVGPACRIPVRITGGGYAFNRNFKDDAAPLACVVDGQVMTVRDAWGTERNGALEAHLSATDQEGKLAVISLQGTVLARQQLTPGCHPAPVEPWTASASREP